MTDIDRLYRTIKRHWSKRRTQVDATAKELEFLVQLLDMMEDEEFASGWISVKDRPPVRPSVIQWPIIRREWYLVALENGVVTVLSYEFDEGRWAISGSPVTHWMPLPMPPGM